MFYRIFIPQDVEVGEQQVWYEGVLSHRRQRVPSGVSALLPLESGALLPAAYI